MTDYGHELQFGIFITPVRRPSRPRGRARAARRRRPASTSSRSRTTPTSRSSSTPGRCCRSSPRRTTHDPRRPQRRSTCRCARRSCSRAAPRAWTCLSGGRVELGLGAGAFWDGDRRHRRPRLTPGQARRRAGRGDRRHPRVWDAASGAVRVTTASTTGSPARTPGPRPAHDIEIWLGAYKPRMLRAHRARRPTAGCRARATLEPDALPAHERRDRRGGAGGRAPARGRPPPAQRHRRVRRRAPGSCRARRGVGRAARRAHADRRA